MSNAPLVVHKISFYDHASKSHHRMLLWDYENTNALDAQTQDRTILSIQRIPKIVVRLWIMHCKNQVVGLFRDLHTLMQGGFHVEKALCKLTDLQTSLYLRSVLLDLYSSILRGLSPSEAFSKHKELFGELSIALIKVNESHNTLSQAFYYIHQHKHQAAAIKKKLSQSMRYPILLFILVSTCLLTLNIYVIPQFNIANEQDIPLPSDSSTWHSLFLMIALFSATFFGLLYRINVKRKGKNSPLKDWTSYVPIIGKMMRRHDVSSFIYVWWLLLESGQDAVAALEHALTILRCPRHTNWALAAVKQVQKGTSIADALKPLLPPLSYQLILVGELTQQLPRSLSCLHQTLHRELQDSIEAYLAWIEPILILLLGLCLLWVVLYAFFPMYDSFLSLV